MSSFSAYWRAYFLSRAWSFCLCSSLMALLTSLAESKVLSSFLALTISAASAWCAQIAVRNISLNDWLSGSVFLFLVHFLTVRWKSTRFNGGRPKVSRRPKPCSAWCIFMICLFTFDGKISCMGIVLWAHWLLLFRRRRKVVGCQPRVKLPINKRHHKRDCLVKYNCISRHNANCYLSIQYRLGHSGLWTDIVTHLGQLRYDLYIFTA